MPKFRQVRVRLPYLGKGVKREDYQKMVDQALNSTNTITDMILNLDLDEEGRKELPNLTGDNIQVEASDEEEEDGIVNRVNDEETEKVAQQAREARLARQAVGSDQTGSIGAQPGSKAVNAATEATKDKKTEGPQGRGNK